MKIYKKHQTFEAIE